MFKNQFLPLRKHSPLDHVVKDVKEVTAVYSEKKTNSYIHAMGRIQCY
jgi:hypothetical protein